MDPVVARAEGLYCPVGDMVRHHGVQLSLHPAGHVLGSAQVRLEYQGAVWVVSGDYKLEDDGTCAAFEALRCDAMRLFCAVRPRQLAGAANGHRRHRRATRVCHPWTGQQHGAMVVRTGPGRAGVQQFS